MIVNSMVYRPGGEFEVINVEDISDALKSPDNFVWLGLWQPDPPFMQNMQEEFGLHELAIEDALTAHQRPKIDQYGESIFIVVKTAYMSDAGRIDFGETHFFVGKNYLVSVRHGPSQSYAPVRMRAQERPEMLTEGGPGYSLYCLLDFIVDHYLEITASLGERITKLEEKMFRSEFDKQAMQEVYTLRRQLLEIRNAALPVNEICNQLIRLHEDIFPKSLRPYLRDVQDHAHHAVMDAENMHEMLTSAMHVNLALVTVQQNEVTKRLAGWGAILVIPTIVFSMYGMNFEHMPEIKSIYGYPVTIGGTFLACYLLYRKLRKTGWL
ncbi:magnesium and cobalt transport protein CorA [Franconibacter sp. IITDAS19]|uniref:magnesium and cobalt transport protein CorA n=1 Tax=Franconibacter sp. IITDAS19 TaxID=2930569 RepID=UPI001FFBC2ED|nr:magnesium and cobalt transport protein CorA [Franconibacter sp. IITDAS19]MCK1970097.1 magnesium and cobalt transport protein CorA [Franconibacter sp. IITDAS19]